MINNLQKDLVLSSITNFLPQIKVAFELGLKISLPDKYCQAKNIVVSGMGGSGLPAEILKALVSDKLNIPFEIIKDYHLPKFASPETLVIPITYSGATEETINITKEAVDRGTMVVGITSGNCLTEVLQKSDNPCLTYLSGLNPSGQPRYGLGYSLGSLWGILVNLRFLEKPNFPDYLPVHKFELKRIKNKIITLVAAEFLAGAVHSARNIINESAKNYADFHLLPELNHHLMEGLVHPKKNRKNLIFIFIDSDLYSPKITERMKLTEIVVRKNRINLLSWKLKTNDKISQVLETTLNGTLLAYQLSSLNRASPLKTPWVDWFKSQLKK